jgi:hypothetical protein
MSMKTKFAPAVLIAGAMMLPFTASATLTTFQAFSGNVGVSVDAGGSTQATLPDGLTSEVPAGSTVVAAYLYTSTWGGLAGSGAVAVGTPYVGGTFNGNSVTYSALAANVNDTGLQAGVADVTSIVAGVVNPSGNAATGGVYNFAVTEANTSNQDGETLVVVYSNPSLPTQSIGILDGGSNSAGDTSMINFSANPAGSTVYMSIGDGFSYDLGGETDQFSTINVDGSLLTAAAGNCDESQDGGTPPNATTCANGDLITAGTLGLNADGTINTAYSNPITAIGDTNVSTDHELYNISSLINPAAGNTITLNTLNSSNNDNIFLEVFDASGLAGFNAPPPPPSGTPEPGTLSMFGLAGGGLYLLRRFRNRVR